MNWWILEWNFIERKGFKMSAIEVKNVREEVSLYIEEMVANEGVSYLEAIMRTCGIFDISDKQITQYLSKPIIEKLEVEVLKSGMVKRNRTLQTF